MILPLWGEPDFLYPTVSTVQPPTTALAHALWQKGTVADSVKPQRVHTGLAHLPVFNLESLTQIVAAALIFLKGSN